MNIALYHNHQSFPVRHLHIPQLFNIGQANALGIYLQFITGGKCKHPGEGAGSHELNHAVVLR